MAGTLPDAAALHEGRPCLWLPSMMHGESVLPSVRRAEAGSASQPGRKIGTASPSFTPAVDFKDLCPVDLCAEDFTSSAKKASKVIFT